MKRFVVLIISAVLLFILNSCKKDNDKKETQNYYVKYEVSYTINRWMHIEVNTENGIQTFETTGKFFSQSFGPVGYGFHATVSANTSFDSDRLNTSIYVCKGEEPYVLKETGYSYSEYTIDF